jgi:hypothetical protein
MSASQEREPSGALTDGQQSINLLIDLPICNILEEAMPRLRIIVASSVLIVGFASAAYAEDQEKMPSSPPSSMMENGNTPMTMNMMQQMSRMMENCNRMMESHMQPGPTLAPQPEKKG